jgi:hypothetical protein
MIGGGVSGSGFTPSSITISGLNPIGKIKTSRRSVRKTGLDL